MKSMIISFFRDIAYIFCRFRMDMERCALFIHSWSHLSLRQL